MSRTLASLMQQVSRNSLIVGHKISIKKNSVWLSPLCDHYRQFLLTSGSSYVIISKLSMDGKNPSNTGNTPSSIDDKNNSNKDGAVTIEKSQDSFFTQDPAFGNKENKGLGSGSRPFFNPEDTEENLLLDYELQPPTNCCMSGCPNCVWLDYVEKLTKVYTNPELSRDKILKELDSMEDQNIKAFIMMELRTRKLI